MTRLNISMKLLELAIKCRRGLSMQAHNTKNSNQFYLNRRLCRKIYQMRSQRIWQRSMGFPMSNNGRNQSTSMTLYSLTLKPFRTGSDPSGGKTYPCMKSSTKTLQNLNQILRLLPRAQTTRLLLPNSTDSCNTA
jgi:hypothetical protein